MVFWLVSLQLVSQRRDSTWELLQEKVGGAGLGSNHKLEIPDLRVGTLDSLMALSDDLSKTSNMMDAVVAKVKRQLNDAGGALANLKVEGVSTDAYIQRFKWDEAKFPARRPLKETVEKLTEIVGRIEDDLKVKSTEYNTLKSQLSQYTRKAQGSLAVRDINQVIKPQQAIDTEHLTTLFVVVSKFAVKEWEDGYEKMCQYIVPRSSALISEDNDYALMSVVLFKRVADDFKAAARSKGYQVREYQAPVEGAELPAAQTAQLKQDVEHKKTALEQWCKTAYGEVFSCYMHLLVVRLFVESILRYGLPPQFQAAVIRPNEKAMNKIRAELDAAFGGGKAQYWKDDGGSLGAGLAGDTELFSYVSLTLSTDSVA